VVHSSTVLDAVPYVLIANRRASSNFSDTDSVIDLREVSRQSSCHDSTPSRNLFPASQFGTIDGNSEPSEDDVYDHEELLQPFVESENTVLRDFLEQEQATEAFKTSTEFGRIVGLCLDIKEELNLLKPPRVRRAKPISVKMGDDIADIADSFCSQVFIEIHDDPKRAGIMYSGSTIR